MLAPVHVSISGPEQIQDMAGTYHWTASASGGDGLGFDYAWGYSHDGTSWSSVGSNSSAYSRDVTTPNDTFYVRVIASSGQNGEEKSDTSQKTVTTASGLEPPVKASISGPSVIQNAGTYTWSAANVSGGSTPLSYSWEACTPGCSQVSTSTSYSRYVNPYTDYNFDEVKLTVYSSTYSTTGNKKAVSQSIYVVPPGGGYAPVRSTSGG